MIHGAAEAEKIAGNGTRQGCLSGILVMKEICETLVVWSATRPVVVSGDRWKLTVHRTGSSHSPDPKEYDLFEEEGWQ